LFSVIENLDIPLPEPVFWNQRFKSKSVQTSEKPGVAQESHKPATCKIFGNKVN
jgi:hypothetical protein